MLICNTSIRQTAIRCCAALSVGVVVLGTGSAAIVAAVHPAAATAALASALSAVTCATAGTTPCLNVKNTSSGIGVLGASNSGTGLRGSSNSNYGVTGTSKTGYGVYGSTTSFGAGVYGSTKSGAAGVVGISDRSYGIYGTTVSGTGTAVIGVTSSGVGVQGSAVSGTALQANSSTGVAFVAQSRSNAAISATSNLGAVALYSDAQNGNGAEISGPNIGVVGRSDSTPLYLSDASGNLVFYVTGHGDVFYHGRLSSFARAAGGTVTAYASKTAQPTFEDTGTAQLAGGVAVVALDPAFAASIDRSRGYRVFLTPDGETRGLYVASKTANGFVVREGLGGHTTTTFDYRIVATELGDSGRRMTLTPGELPPSAPTARLRARGARLATGQQYAAGSNTRASKFTSA